MSRNIVKKYKKKAKESTGFILPFWNNVFELLEYISIFALIRVVKKKLTDKNLSYRFVEIWVFSNLIVSITASIAAYSGISIAVSALIIGYGMLRVFEIIIYQINVLLFHPYRLS
ncbi:MAG: hypothetical protein COA82_04935 [Alkaliphilus sp.]|nr:MAG: hypothetical protein COA82_04935 [Alkaliphilus sp.]